MFLNILTFYEYLLRADTSDPWYDIIWFSPFHVSAPRGPYPWVRGYVGPTHWQARAIIEIILRFFGWGVRHHSGGYDLKVACKEFSNT